VPVEVLAVIAHRGPGVGVAGSDLNVAQVHASVEHGRCVAACANASSATGPCGLGQIRGPASSGVPDPSTAESGTQEAAVTAVARPIDGAGDCRWWGTRTTSPRTRSTGAVIAGGGLIVLCRGFGAVKPGQARGRTAAETPEEW
jgi:hypothetical protein